MKSLRYGIVSSHDTLGEKIDSLEKKLDLVIDSYVNTVDPEKEANEIKDKRLSTLFRLRREFYNDIFHTTKVIPTAKEVDKAILASGYKFDKELLDE